MPNGEIFPPVKFSVDPMPSWHRSYAAASGRSGGSRERNTQTSTTRSCLARVVRLLAHRY